jgi:hypothetical protein
MSPIDRGAARRTELLSAQSLLTNFLHGRITAEEALAAWPVVNRASDKLVKKAWHRLNHYVDDADIRAREPSYEAAQKRQLQKYLDAMTHASEGDPTKCRGRQ